MYFCLCYIVVSSPYIHVVVFGWGFLWTILLLALWHLWFFSDRFVFACVVACAVCLRSPSSANCFAHVGHVDVVSGVSRSCIFCFVVVLKKRFGLLSFPTSSMFGLSGIGFSS